MLPLKWCSLGSSLSSWPWEVLGTLWRSSSPYTGRLALYLLKKCRSFLVCIHHSPLELRSWEQRKQKVEKAEWHGAILAAHLVLCTSFFRFRPSIKFISNANTDSYLNSKCNNISRKHLCNYQTNHTVWRLNVGIRIGYVKKKRQQKKGHSSWFY